MNLPFCDELQLYPNVLRVSHVLLPSLNHPINDRWNLYNDKKNSRRHEESVILRALQDSYSSVSLAHYVFHWNYFLASSRGSQSSGRYSFGKRNKILRTTSALCVSQILLPIVQYRQSIWELRLSEKNIKITHDDARNRSFCVNWRCVMESLWPFNRTMPVSATMSQITIDESWNWYW